MNELQRIARGNGTRFENWFFAVLFLILSATWVYAADYGASQKVDGLAAVGSALLTTTRVPVQDPADLDKLAYTTVATLMATGGSIYVITDGTNTSTLQWETGTADDILEWYFPESNGTLIPGIIFGDATMEGLTEAGGALLNTFDDKTEPFLALFNDTGDSWSIWNSNNDDPTITVGGNATTFTIPNLTMGSMAFPEDSGAIEAMDMPVSTTDGLEQSYAFRIDNNPVLTVYGEGDGGEGAEAVKVIVHGVEAESAILEMWSDQGDDNADKWHFLANDGGNLDIETYTSGSWVNAAVLTNAGNFSAVTYGVAGTVTDAELTYISDLTSAVQVQLDARALESVVGTSLGGGLALASTVLNVVNTEQLGGDNADVDVAAASHYNGILNNDGQASQALEFDLDACAAGMSFIVVIGTDDDNNTYVHPNGAENMYLDGTAIGVNERIVNASASMDVGDTLSCKAITTGGTVTWHCYTVVGTWADSGDDGD